MKKSKSSKKKTAKKSRQTLTKKQVEKLTADKIDASKLKVDTSPKAKLIEFLEAWKSQDHERMAKHCNKSWLLDAHSNFTAEGWIYGHFGYLSLEKYSIGEPVRIGECMLQFPVKAVIKSGAVEPASCLMNINVLCELAPYKPDLKGEWGVNPVSATQISWNVK